MDDLGAMQHTLDVNRAGFFARYGDREPRIGLRERRVHLCIVPRPANGARRD